MRADRSKRLTVLSEAERLALYGLPDFDDFQRAEFFALSATERALVVPAQGAGGTGLVPAADRVFQGQAGLLRLLLARRSA
jgi:hypothetical protein